MFIELTDGKDSFRKHGNSSRRNVSVVSFVRTKDGEGNSVIPLFAAYQKKLKGFGETNLVSSIPATEAHGPSIGGVWFVNRREVLPGTEILLEYRRRDSTPGTFGENVEYTMLIMDANAPLYQMRLELPKHHLAAVPYVFFVGRFEILEKDTTLTDASRKVWKDFLNLDDDFDVSDLMDPNQDERFWVTTELEGRIKITKRMERVETASGGRRMRIRRTRQIKIK